MVIGNPTVLNLIPGAVMPVVNVNQYDAGYDKAFLLYSGSDVYNITENLVVSVRGTKADKNGYAAAATYTPGSNYVTFTLTEQMTAAAGPNIFEFRIADMNGFLVGTINFVLLVEPAALGDGTVISDSDLNYAAYVLDKIQTEEATKNQVNRNTADIAELDYTVDRIQNYSSTLIASVPHHLASDPGYNDGQSIFKISSGVYGILSTSNSGSSDTTNIDAKLWIVDTAQQTLAANQYILTNAYHANGACYVDDVLYVAPSYSNTIRRYDGTNSFAEMTPITVTGLDNNMVEAVCYDESDNIFYVMDRGDIYSVPNDGSTSVTATKLFTLPSAFPDVVPVDNIGSVGYDNNGFFWVSGVAPNWLMQVSKTGERLLCYGVGSDQGEPEGVTFDNGLIIQLFSKAYTYWRLYDIYAIDINQPYAPYDLFLNPGVTRKYVDASTTVLLRNGTISAPFVCLNEALDVAARNEIEAVKIYVIGNHPAASLQKKNFSIAGYDSSSSIDRLSLVSCIGSIEDIIINNNVADQYGISMQNSLIRLASTTITANSDSSGQINGNGVLIVDSASNGMTGSFNGFIGGSGASKFTNPIGPSANYYSGYRLAKALSQSAAEQTAKSVTIPAAQVGTYTEFGFIVWRTPINFKQANPSTSNTYNRNFIYVGPDDHTLYAVRISLTGTKNADGSLTWTWAYAAYNPADGSQVSLPTTCYLAVYYSCI